MQIQITELHFSKLPKFDASAVRSRVEALLRSEVTCNEKDDPVVFFHLEHKFKIEDGAISPCTTILSRNEKVDLSHYAEDIQQSWASPNKDDLLRNSNHTLLVTEMMAQAFAPEIRLKIFHAVLQAIVEQTNPQALVFKHTQQVIDPKIYLDRCNDEPIRRPGSLNVRFFNISNSDGEMVMDTRGLTEIGLHDLQCHYRNLDPNKVSGMLFNSAIYIFENGPVIESGNTIEGTEPGSKWKCQFENSLLKPDRELLNIQPEAPFAAGNYS